MQATRRLTALSAFALVTGVCALAHGDASGWLHTGGGVYGWQMEDSGDFQFSPTMLIDAGLGSDPDEMFIGGAFFRVQPLFGHGTDLEFMARFCNGTFQTDYVGFAIDAGLYQRFWGVQSTGFVGEAVLGLPFGFELAALGTYGTHDAKGFSVSLGIDFIRLTVDRRYLTDWWPNPQSTDAMKTALENDAARARGGF